MINKKSSVKGLTLPQLDIEGYLTGGYVFLASILGVTYFHSPYRGKIIGVLIVWLAIIFVLSIFNIRSLHRAGNKWLASIVKGAMYGIGIQLLTPKIIHKAMLGYILKRPSLTLAARRLRNQQIKSLKAGDIVKLIFKVDKDVPERLWVILDAVPDSKDWTGVIDNDAMQPTTAATLPAGKRVEFRPSFIHSIYEDK